MSVYMPVVSLSVQLLPADSNPSYARYGPKGEANSKQNVPMSIYLPPTGVAEDNDEAFILRPAGGEIRQRATLRTQGDQTQQEGTK